MDISRSTSENGNSTQLHTLGDDVQRMLVQLGALQEQLPGGPMAAGVEASSRSASQVVSCQSNAAGKAGQAPSAFAGSGSLKSSWQHGSYGSLIEKLNEENVSAPFGHEQQITLGRGREGALARRRRTMTEHSEDFVEIKQSVRAATARVPPAVEDPVPLQQQQPGALLGRPNQGAQTTLGASLHVGEPKPAESSTTPAAPAHTPAWVGSGYLKLIEKANEMSIDQRKRENVVKYHTPHEQHISLRRHDENDSLRRRTLNEHLDDTEEILQFKQSVRAATARVPPAVEAPVPLQQQQPGALLGRPNQGAQTTLGASLHVGEPKLAESSATPVAPAHTPEPCRTDQPESVAKNAEIHLRESHTLKSQRDPPSTSRGPGEEPTSEQATLAMHRQWRQLQEQLFMPGPSQLQLLSVHEPTKIHQYPLQQREQLDSQLKEKRMQAPQIGQIIPASLMLQQQAGQLQGQQGQPHLSSDMLGQQAGQQAGYLPLSRQLVQGQQARQMPSLSMQMQGQQAGQLQGQQAGQMPSLSMQMQGQQAGQLQSPLTLQMQGQLGQVQGEQGQAAQSLHGMQPQVAPVQGQAPPSTETQLQHAGQVHTRMHGEAPISVQLQQGLQFMPPLSAQVQGQQAGQMLHQASSSSRTMQQQSGQMQGQAPLSAHMPGQQTSYALLPRQQTVLQQQAGQMQGQMQRQAPLSLQMQLQQARQLQGQQGQPLMSSQLQGQQGQPLMSSQLQGQQGQPLMSSQLQGQPLMSSQLQEQQGQPLMSSQLQGQQGQPLMSSQLQGQQGQPLMSSQLQGHQGQPLMSSQLQGQQGQPLMSSQLQGQQAGQAQGQLGPGASFQSEIVEESSGLHMQRSQNSDSSSDVLTSLAVPRHEESEYKTAMKWWGKTIHRSLATAPEGEYRVGVALVAGRSLPIMDYMGLCDPYVALKVDGVQMLSRYQVVRRPLRCFQHDHCCA
ncbi:hypothetical protein CYMTET_39535 [Cymbomonas tetramitiformis]|uniref:Uncharacterized protein n=1 Tax=Cymbomonas tetramitiformis TaxID=36881 RepID=A0AAE0CB34_9CHLO|nr:hypothetical protein CYMTET_39535 [Cymbomonas tetramitiformis]